MWMPEGRYPLLIYMWMRWSLYEQLTNMRGGRGRTAGGREVWLHEMATHTSRAPTHLVLWPIHYTSCPSHYIATLAANPTTLGSGSTHSQHCPQPLGR
ncbi:hypothetical protein PR048_011262 [Dryococelus australis]|uniref:Uncharacterized protein n=1 Tax=Dryococelus australis TaxID=614101 RepID=A0ABQ9HLU7_9NEOP|nr:hypothetical protein PR048_011262 [Dryococelus australis]